ncbi:MAG: hypothetical protein HDS35_05515 [Bacteroides sp.]|nr:hypothetical protein [Bacteroides sp.]
MIKKWSYVVATAATVFGGTFLTGCIDNDEPFGIEQIRVETANLLKAKQALVAADAAAKQAQAELDKANAEIAKVNAEVAKAKAEAEMKLAELEKQAEIARQNAESAAQVALIEAQIADQKAKTEAYIAEQKAILDNMIAQNELTIKNLQLEYDKLAYQWELSKIQDALTVSSDLWDQLNAAYTTYLQELNAYNQKAQNLADMQRKSAQWLNDLVYNEEKNTWEHPKEKYKNMLVDAIDAQEQNVANAQNAINSLNQNIADFENIKTNNDVYTKWSELSNNLKDNDAKIAELKIEQAEIELNNQSLLNEISTLWEAYLAVGNKEIAIPAYTFEPSAAAQQLGIMQPIEVVPSGESYSLNGDWKYTYYQSRYRNTIDNLKHYLLDENDKAWTNARLNEMQRELVPLQKTYDAAKALWENAKKVYNMGNEPDASALPLESELEAAITAYNALEDKYATLKEKIETAHKEYEAADQEYWNAINAGDFYNQDWKDANDAYNNAINAANDAYWKAYNDAYAALNQAIQNANESTDNAWKAYDRAVREYNTLLSELNQNPDDKTLQNSVNAAKDKMEKADAAYTKAQQDASTAKSKAQTTCDRTVAAAETTRVLAENKAQEAYDKAHAAWVAAGGHDAEITALENARQQKWDALQAAEEEVEVTRESSVALCNAMLEAQDKQLNEIGLYYWMYGYSSIPQVWRIDNYINSVKYNWSGYDFPTAEAPINYIDKEDVNGNGNKVEYLNAKYYLIEKSKAAYGNLGYPWDSSQFNGTSHDWVSNLEIDEAFLVDEVTTDMLNAYVKNYVQRNEGWTPEDYQCIVYYYMFGDFGTLKTLENRIEVAKANLENSDLISNVLGTMETNLNDLIASIDPVKEEQAKAKEAYDAKQAQYAKLFDDVNEQLGALNYQNEIINRVIAAINENFELLNDQNAANPEAVQNTIDYYKRLVAYQQNVLADAQKALKEAQDNLALLENGNAEYDYNPYTAQIDQLTAELEVSKDQLAAVKARLDEIQAKYEAAAQQ